MTEMIERVAAAICEEDGGNWNTADDLNKLAYRAFARVAIEAMREPTFDMSRAGGAEHSYLRYEEGSDEEAARIFTAMIDAALGKEGSDG